MMNGKKGKMGDGDHGGEYKKSYGHQMDHYGRVGGGKDRMKPKGENWNSKSDQELTQECAGKVNKHPLKSGNSNRA